MAYKRVSINLSTQSFTDFVGILDWRGADFDITSMSSKTILYIYTFMNLKGVISCKL
jgi:hypothetical protein